MHKWSVPSVLQDVCVERLEERPFLLQAKRDIHGFDERVNDLVARMTLEEKISQTLNKSAAIERLGVPEYEWWNEALHGVARAGHATVTATRPDQETQLRRSLSESWRRTMGIEPTERSLSTRPDRF